jgi:predicted  nucleic acid-binding Zn-ribbon protein
MDDFMKDPNIASVREDLALADVRLSMKLEQMETAETGERWEKLEEKVDVLSDALTEGDTDTASAALAEIQEIVKEGAEMEESWDEVFDIMEQKRKLAETENKRIKASSNTLTVEEASMLVDVMVSLMQDVAERYDLPNQALRDINEATRDLLDT